ncbi:M15 family metallopeptidase [Maridesulfovibrio hydrothermalis]|uniref:D-alanyl-D-alanine dipeptidase n=1 Tax=Maridesulfovibrio hydrothermalis AM13 = DSM 14728 TaxID=1121451 RepID=L0RIR5_9BACT|nr:M15 family metallopeptidase [Maridesulfovibrio hydrothermalis]CCO25466.1 D-alanyl-D-alanine dipeptidase [Maridesulfovibrio hydrothermalis AM13 = DSM 14728]
MIIKANYIRLCIMIVALLILSLTAPVAESKSLHDNFCYLDEVVPDAAFDARYYSENNFVGERINGYNAPKVVLTVVAAKALAEVQKELAPFGLGLKFFDGYRPQRAVHHFVRWAENLSDIRMKSVFYPDVEKKNLFRDGYIAAKSGHSRGSTIDLTIISLHTGKELDMGTPFDFFGPRSWPHNTKLPAQVRANRALLRQIMIANGFKGLKEEWWHFTLRNEPYPETYFDFPVQ